MPLRSSGPRDFLEALTATVDRLSRVKPASDRLVAERVVARPWVRMAIGPDGLAALLPPVAGAGHAPLEFANLRVRFNAVCTIETRHGVTREALVVVECTSSDTRLQRAFLRALSVVLPPSDEVTGTELESAIRDLADLFLAAQAPAKGTILGLWGELLLIAESSNPELAVDSWHCDPAERFDFGLDTTRVEVKTCSGQSRSHLFSLTQLQSPGNSRVVVASIMTTPLAGGTSMARLIERISVLIGPDRAARLGRVVMDTLGNSWELGLASCFDEQLALDTVRAFDAAVIPSVGEVADGVSEVRFRSDLTFAPAMKASEVAVAGRLVEALLAVVNR